MKISLLGSIREVTGSSYLTKTENHRFRVDCRMVQGRRKAVSCAVGRRLVGGAGHFRTVPTQAFVVHGDTKAALVFSRLLKDCCGWKTLVSEHGKSVYWNGQTQRLVP